ncbi:MAG: NUDIX hydrolase [Sphingomonas sp.]
MNDSPSAPIPAATLVVLRDRSDGAPPDLLMLERGAAMAFAAGALVFPGGRIDPGDQALAAAYAVPAAAARIAAIRETIEECGLAVALSPRPDAATLANLRRALHAGEPFADLLGAAGIALDLAALEPFARWRPDHKPTRIFDTHFFLARLPEGAPLPSADGGETVRVFWASARRVLADADAGRARIIFPTRRNLERLARFGSHADAVADARAHPVRLVTPWIEDRDGVPHLCIDDDLGYPVTAEPLDAVARG